MKIQLTLALSLLTSLTACALEDSDPDGQLSETEQHMTGYSVVEADAEGPDFVEKDLGPTTDRTCFLMGIGGSMESGTEIYEAALAGTHINGNRWLLGVAPGQPGARLLAQSQCVGTTAGRTSEISWDWMYDSGKKVLAPYSATTACFITQLGQVHLDNDNRIFNSASSSLRITHDAQYWYIGGTGYAAGLARCVTVNARAAEVQGDGGTRTVLTDKSGHQCFLTGIKGKIRATDYQTGVSVNYSPTITTRDLLVFPGYTGWATCMN